MPQNKKPTDLLQAVKKFETQLKNKGLMKAGDHISSLTFGEKKAKKKSEIKHTATATSAGGGERPCLKTKKIPVKVFDPELGKFVTIIREVCVLWG